MNTEVESLTINKYWIKLLDANRKVLKSKTVISTTPLMAINEVRNETWWYDEGEGYDHVSFKWPLTFIAELINN